MKSKISILTKAAFFNLLGANQAKSTNKKNKKKKASKTKSPWFALGLQIFLFLYLGAVYADKIYDASFEALPSELLSVMSFLNLMILFISTSLAPAILYRFKDGDMLQALPLKKEEILLSKFATYMAYMYLYTFCLFIPSILMAGIKFSLGPVYYINALIGLIFLPGVPAALGSLLTLGLLKIIAGKKHEELYQNAFMVLFVVMMVLQPGLQMSDVFSKVALQLNYYLTAMLDQNILDLLLFVGINALALFAFFKGFSKSIFKVNAQMQTGYHVKNFKAKRTNSLGVKKALFQRELKRFFSIFSYVLNLAMSMFIVLGFTIYAAINRNEFTELLRSLGDGTTQTQLSLMYLFGICLMAMMCVVNAVSISLEGDKLWILQTAPISSKDLFTAKIKCNMTIILVPTILSYTVASFFILQNSILYYLAGVILLIILAYGVSVFGLVINLRFPMLEFDREIVVIKQSTSSMIATFTAMGLIVLSGYLAKVGAMDLALSAEMMFGIYFAVVTIVTIILHYTLYNYGVRKFAQLSN